MASTYKSFAAHRDAAIRLAGRYIVELIEAGHTVEQLTAPTGPVKPCGAVKGTDADARGCIGLSKVSKSRKSSAFRALNSSKAFLPKGR